MKVRVMVRLKEGVLDVQGKAVERALHGLGSETVADLRVGKLIEFTLPDQPQAEARKLVDQMCEQLLVNTVIERYEVSFS